MPNIHISHTPSDKDFSERLRSALAVKGHEITKTVADGKEKDDVTDTGRSHLRENTDITLCILTPSFLTNALCLQETLDSLWNNIPVITVVYKHVNDEKVPACLASSPCIPNEGLFNENYEQSLEDLLGKIQSVLSSPDTPSAATKTVKKKAVGQTASTKRSGNDRHRNGDRRRNLAVPALAVLLVAAVALDVVGFTSSSGPGAGQDAYANQLAAAAEGAAYTDPALAVKLSLAALSKSDTASAEAALRQTLPELQQKALLYQPGTPDITDAAFSPNGKEAASVSTDGFISIWSTATGSLVKTIKEPDSAPISSVAYNSNGTGLLTASLSGYARVFSPATGKLLATLKQPSGAPLYDAQFSPNSAEVITAAANGAVGIFSLASKKQVGQIVSPNNAATFSASVSPNGNALAIASVNGSASIYIAHRSSPVVLKVGGEVTAVAFTPDSRELVTAQGNGTAKIWEVSTGKLLATLGSVGGPPLSDVAVSPSGVNIAVAGNNGTLILYNTVTGVETAKLNGATGIINSVEFSPNGKELLTGEQDGTIRIWNVSQPAQLNSFQEPAGGDILNIAYSPNGKQIATASADGSVRIWSSDSAVQTSVAYFPNHASPTALSFSPNGKELVVAGSNGKGFLYQSHKQLLTNFTDPTGAPFLSAAYSPNGKDIIFGTQDGYARIYNVTTGKLVESIKEPSGATVYQAAYSPNGQYIATASRDGSLTLYNASTYKKIWKGSDNGAPSLLTLSFNTSGNKIVTASSNGEISIFSVQTGHIIQLISNYENLLISGASFEPNSDNVIVAANNGEALLYDSTNNQLLTVFGIPSAPPVSQAIFSPDAGQVATVNNLGIVSLWSPSMAGNIGQLENMAHSMLPALSPTESHEYESSLNS